MNNHTLADNWQQWWSINPLRPLIEEKNPNTAAAQFLQALENAFYSGAFCSFSIFASSRKDETNDDIMQRVASLAAELNVYLNKTYPLEGGGGDYWKRLLLQLLGDDQ